MIFQTIKLPGLHSVIFKVLFLKFFLKQSKKHTEENQQALITKKMFNK